MKATRFYQKKSQSSSHKEGKGNHKKKGKRNILSEWPGKYLSNWMEDNYNLIQTQACLINSMLTSNIFSFFFEISLNKPTHWASIILTKLFRRKAFFSIKSTVQDWNRFLPKCTAEMSGNILQYWSTKAKPTFFNHDTTAASLWWVRNLTESRTPLPSLKSAVSRAGARPCRDLPVNSRVMFLSEFKYILPLITKEKAQGRKPKPH